MEVWVNLRCCIQRYHFQAMEEFLVAQVFESSDLIICYNFQALTMCSCNRKWANCFKYLIIFFNFITPFQLFKATKKYQFETEVPCHCLYLGVRYDL